MLEEALKGLLAESATVKIGTASPDGTPWVATAYFAESGLFRLEVLLEAVGRTLKNIRNNHRVALMIENGDAIALFAQAEASTNIIDEQHGRIRDAIIAKTPGSAPLVKLPHLVGVQLNVTRWRVTHVAAGWLPAQALLAP